MTKNAFDFDTAREHFTTLAQPHALEVLFCLKDQPRTVQQLEADLALSGTQLNQVLTTLRRARLISLQKQAQSLLYHIPQPNIAHLIQQIYQSYP